MADELPARLSTGSSSSSIRRLSVAQAPQAPVTIPDSTSAPEIPDATNAPSEKELPAVNLDVAPQADPPLIVVHDASPVPEDLKPPIPAFLGRPISSTDQSFASTQPASSRHTLVGENEASSTKELIPPDEATTPDTAPSQALAKRRRLIFAAVGLLLVIILAVAIAVPLATRHHSTSPTASSPSNGGPSDGGGGSSQGPNSTSTLPITGANGSTVTTETGETFLYVNSFDGFWYDDPNDPYNNNAQAQSWSPPLSQQWDYQQDTIRGVNLGGWLVPEPFIVPALFERYANASTPAVDEYTLSQAMAADAANGGLSQLEGHYKTFITEEDFAKIAGAGLNWIRLPIPFWAIETYADEPYLEGVAWKYALKAFKWARKYGLRINLDLHAVPGSQNGYNHSGKSGSINFLRGVMGIANAQRTLDYLRIIVEFISQPEFANVVPMLGVFNEPNMSQIGGDALVSFYLFMHETLRNITGYGEGHGPYLSIHDGFGGLNIWVGVFPGGDRIALDTHPYFVFGGNVNTAPVSDQIEAPCSSYAATFNTSWSNFGVTTAGEWSLAINDCSLWLNGVGSTSNYEAKVGPGSCDDWINYSNWTDSRKQDFQKLAYSWMDALQHWFYWTWKIGASSVSGQIESPMWSYSLGLENGWIPPDPRLSTGACGGGSPAEPLQANMTSGGEIDATVRQANPWPPKLNPNGMAGDTLPSYTATGPIPTLPAPTGLTGWFDQADTRPMYTPIAACTYPGEYDSENIAVPPQCTG